MRRLRALAIATGVLLGAAAALADEGKAPAPTLQATLESQGYTHVALAKASTGHLLIESEINGVKGKLVVDSGSSVTVLDSTAKRALGIDESHAMPIPAVGFGATTGSIEMAAVASVVVGPLRFENRPMFLTDLAQLTKVLEAMSGEKILGILGQDLLENHGAIIDVSNRVLYLKVD
jgi:predicted aspartyl protease